MIKSIIDILTSWEIDMKTILARVILGLVVLFIFYLIAKVSKYLANRVNSKFLSKYPDVQLIFANLFYFFFLAIGIYIFLEIVGLEQYFVKILAGAGIAGIIAGFALKDIASNTFSGFLLFLEKPYKKDDWVQIDGHYGKILKVGVITTSMINRSGHQIYVSNQLIYSGVFINYSTYAQRAIKIQTDVIQHFDIENIKRALSAELNTINEIVADTPIQYYISSINAGGNFTLRIYLMVHFKDEREHLDIVSQIIYLIKKASINNNIVMLNTLWISDEDDTTSVGDYGVGG